MDSSRYASKLERQLIEACFIQPIDVIEHLISKGARVNPGIYESPLYNACIGKNIEVVKLLISLNADVNFIDNNSLIWNPLIAACFKFGGHLEPNPEIVSLLLEAGASICSKSIDGGKAIHYARSIPILETLISYGADIEAVTNSGRTLLMEACIDEKADITFIQYLVDCGADTETTDRRGANIRHNMIFMSSRSSESKSKIMNILRKSLD